MKFNMMIGGVETLFPETDVRYFKEDNEIIIYFLNIKKDNVKHILKHIKKSELRIENDYFLLKLKNIQYAYNIKKTPQLIKTYLNGCGLGFAFEDENGKLLEIDTPIYHHAV